MAYRNYILTLLFGLACFSAKGQTIGYQEADSISFVQYQAKDWTKLLSYGRQVIAAGTDFPNLRLRIAYANLMAGNYSAAISNYNHVLADDAHNRTAHYYSYLSNLYLNHYATAYYHRSYIDTNTFDRPNGLQRAGFETGIRFPDNVLRGNGVYTRASIANRLGWRVQLDQSIVYFGQRIDYRPASPTIEDASSGIYSNPVNQIEYYGKFNVSLNGSFSVWSGYHYLHSQYASASYNTHIGFLGLEYISPYFDAQADAGLANENFQQYNLQVMFYPTGSLNFYTLTRGSWLQNNGTHNAVISQLLGFKLTGKSWLETFGNFGKQNNYQEADGLYVYNALDVIQFKTGATGYYQVTPKAMFHLNYTYERKNDFYQNTNYNQHSITAGLTWKF